MDNTLVFDSLEQFNQFLNDKGVLEIVVRGNKQRIKDFQKVAINNLQQSESKEVVEKAINALNKNNETNLRNINLLGNVMKVEQIGLLLNGLNLCATCIGFAIMNEKLNGISAQIDGQIGKLQKNMMQVQDVQTNHQFNKVLSEHMDMLDHRKLKKPYSEDQMRQLVDHEREVLSYLTDVLKKDLSDDKRNLLFSIFSLLSMFTVSLRYYDELYYYENKEVLNQDDPWHGSHDKWTGIYDILSETWFLEKLQDFAVFETNLNTLGVDCYCLGLMDQVKDARQTVLDNQSLILAIDNIEQLHNIKSESDRFVKEQLSDSLNESGISPENPVLISAMKQVGLPC